MLQPERVEQFKSNVVFVRNLVVQLSQMDANNQVQLPPLGGSLIGFQEYCQMIEQDCKLLSSKEKGQLKIFKTLDNTSDRLAPENVFLYLSQINNFLWIKAPNLQQQWANYLEKIIENSIKYQYCSSPNTIKNCLISFYNMIVKTQKSQEQQKKFYKIIASMLKKLIRYYFQRKAKSINMLFFDRFHLQKSQQLLLNQTQWFSYCFTKIFSSPTNSSLIFEQMLNQSTNIAYYTLHMIGNFFQDMIDKRITTQLVHGFGCEIKDIKQMYNSNNKCLVELKITQQNLAYLCRYFLKHLRIQIESTIKYIKLSVEKNLNHEEIELLLKQSRQQMDLILQIIHNLNSIVFIGGYNNKLQNFVTSIVLEESTVYLEFFQISYLLYRCIEASKMTAKVTLMVEVEKQSQSNLFRIAGVPQNTQLNSLDLRKILVDGQLVGVLRLLTNLVHINHRSQLPFENNPKYLHMILSLTHDSVSQATMKEWAIMFIRNVSQWSQVLREELGKVKIEMRVQ